MDEPENPQEPAPHVRHQPRRVDRPRVPPLPEQTPATARPRDAAPAATSPETSRVRPASARPNPRLNPGMELREVVQGRRTKSSFVRVMTTEAKGGFRRRASGVLEVTQEGSRPRGGLARFTGRLKGLFVGAPLSTAQLAHERLTNVKALAVFSSDAISSSAYAPGEILIILALAGSAHLGLAIPIGLAILALLAIVTLSYRQTIRAYPNGGGAYIVARENLGELPGQAAAGALLVDYILTVSVSVAAGIAAIIAALPSLAHYRVEMGVAAIVIVTLINLRGVSESGTIFAIPTYAFILCGFALLIVGAIKVVTGNAQPVSYSEGLVATHSLGIFLVLRAFSSGCAALTGVEAISNGVPAFKSPESKNASQTLLWMAAILAILFFGMLWLANRYGLHEVENETVVSQLGEQVFGQNLFFYIWQAATALILMLAANTSFADFPRLASLLARDSYMPRQFTFRGDRLAFSNGIIVLGFAATVLYFAFGGEVTRLIPLYAIGVFVSFSLSQGGMVLHWRHNHQEKAWRRSMVINGAGAVASAIVAVIIILTKFATGAWMSILIGILLVFLFRAIHRHYQGVDERLRLPELDEGGPLPFATREQTMIVPVRALNRPSLRALGYARSICKDVTALHVTDDMEDAQKIREQWEHWGGDIELVIIESPYRSFTQPLLSYIDLIEQNKPGTLLTVVLPEFVPRHWWQTLLHGQDALRLKATLLFRKDTVVIDVPDHLDDPRPRQPATAGGDGVSR